MHFISTRNASTAVGLSQAIAQGISAEGGLFVPASFPAFSMDQFTDTQDLPTLAARLLGAFAVGDALEKEIPAICREAFNFPAPLVPLKNSPGPVQVLELFHGPTAAFKDFGARFLAACLERIRRSATRKLTILVATSGDTGGAVAAAFYRRPGMQVGVLYPKGLVAPRQAQQLACWGENVQTFTVRGTFDDCQRLVKEAFTDPQLARTHELSSANSINIGRLLPQMTYYAHASLDVWRATGQAANFIVPSGNVGNATACLFAKQCGLPIGRIVLAVNANRTIPDYLHSGEYRPRPSIATLANAMDVGHPSNLERLRALFPTIDALRAQITADSVSDAEIRARIVADVRQYDRVWCPHTAVAAEVYARLADTLKREPWVIVATAHPAKFNDVVEPLIGRPLEVPEALAKLLTLPKIEREIDATLVALRGALQP